MQVDVNALLKLTKDKNKICIFMLGIEKAFSKYDDFGGNGFLSFQKITKQFRKKRLNNS